MDVIKSSHYRRSRLKNQVRGAVKKIFQLGLFVIVGEYMLLHVINASLSSVYEQQPLINYRDVPHQIINLAVGERPILHVARTVDAMRKKAEFDSWQKNADFDNIIQKQYPVQVRGSRQEFTTADLQAKEGAKIGYVLKF